jgi:NAD(P)-dependent dehydrogenase (short-subunit alcohol dehydrogenase family)
VDVVTETRTVRPANPWATRALSVFVAAYNEVDNLGPTVETLLDALAQTIEEYEIIVVNDGSTDGTREVADALASTHPAVRVIHLARNQGLGYGWMQAVKAATKPYFVFVPGDNTWPYPSLRALFGSLGKADVVTSYATNPEIRSTPRRVISSVYTAGLNVMFGLDLRYYHGLTIYPTDFLRANPITTHGFASMAEALLKAIDSGLSYVEVPCAIEERATGQSKAVSLHSLKSVVGTIGGLFVDLRLRSKKGPRTTLGLRRLFPRTGKRFVTVPSTVGGSANGVVSDGVAASPTSKVSQDQQPLRVVIAGGSSGIGAEVTRALAEAGHQVFVCARRQDRLDDVTAGETIARGYVCDVSDEAQVTGFARWLTEQTPAVDVLLNCAGTFGPIGPFETTDSAEWLDAIKVNLFGTYLVSKHLLPLLSESDDPRILNFSGGGAFDPFPNYSAYACSKAAVVRLTENLAAELAPRGIAVNAVAPGFVATEVHLKTLDVGPERAGALHYQRTKAALDGGGKSIATAVECVLMLLSRRTRGMTGKTISANFDPWRTDALTRRLGEITRSDLWTMRRINLVNLPEGSLRTELSEAQGGHGART